LTGILAGENLYFLIAQWFRWWDLVCFVVVFASFIGCAVLTRKRNYQITEGNWHKNFFEKVHSRNPEGVEPERQMMDDCRRFDGVVTPVIVPDGLLDFKVADRKVVLNPRNGTRKRMELQQEAMRRAYRQVLKDWFIEHIIMGKPIEGEAKDENVCDS